MQLKHFFLILLLLISIFMMSCTTQEELSFSIDLKDKNLGYTIADVPVSCIVTNPELVASINVTLVDQNNQTFSIQTTEVSTITSVLFEALPGGTYTSSCIACDEATCAYSEEGKVLVSVEDTQEQEFEFDVPPSFILGTPIDGTYFLSADPLLVSFSCLATDDVGLSAVSLVSNISGLFAETFIQNPTKSSHLLVKDLVLEPGKYLWTCRATDTRAQTIVAPVRTFTIGAATPEILPNVQGFDGDTTDFENLDALTNIPGVVIEDTDFGKISFVDNISSLVGVDFSKGVIITKDSITVNSSLYPQLNVPAKLSFYDLQFDEEVEEVNVEKDGSTYSVQNLSFANGTLTFTVGNFSTYKVVITPQGGYNLEETPLEEEVVGDIAEEIVEEEEIIPRDEEVKEEVIEEKPQEEVVKDITEEVVEEPPLENTQEENDGKEDTFVEEVEGGAAYFNPLRIAALIVIFVLVIVLVVWLVKQQSKKTMLRKY